LGWFGVEFKQIPKFHTKPPQHTWIEDFEVDTWASQQSQKRNIEALLATEVLAEC